MFFTFLVSHTAVNQQSEHKYYLYTVFENLVDLGYTIYNLK